MDVHEINEDLIVVVGMIGEERMDGGFVDYSFSLTKLDDCAESIVVEVDALIVVGVVGLIFLLFV